MAEVIRMPRLSDTMSEGIIAEWHKKVGDKIKPGDVLADVETDKATMELESYNEGVLLFIGIEKGKGAPVDGILAIVGKEGEDYKTLLDKEGKTEGGNNQPAEKSKADVPEQRKENIKTENKKSENTEATKHTNVAIPEGAKEIRMPLLSDTMTEGKIISWNKKVGDKVKADDVLAEVETDKATMEVVGYEEGTLLYTGVEEGKAAKVNEIIAIVGKPGTDVSGYISSEKNKTSSGEAIPEPAAEKNNKVVAEQKADSKELEKQPVSAESNNGRIKASPLAKKLAEDKGVDLSQITGSGDGGRITKKDVDEFKVKEYKPVTSLEKGKVSEFKSQSEEGFIDLPLSQMRKTIARRLGESMFSAPHFYLTMEINMDNAIASRNEMNEISPVKISFNDLIIKACATALRLHPAVNSSWMGDFIRQNHHIHIGSAVAMPEGLIVPVIRFADQKTLSQIAADAKQLYTKAKEKKIQPDEFSGNTFTISNLGMMDIEEFTAIINPPDSCILAVGRIKETVVRKNNEFVVTNVMKVTLSCDHRSVDGATGAAFLQSVKKFIENPVMMLV
ncbi:MAG: pyruvate dehydrogenase complex dihydrolipoamide acetyltransferase [Ferruginibacter sp.]